jgi:hypothetical protein
MVNLDFEKFKEIQEKHKSIYLGRNKNSENEGNPVKEIRTSAGIENANMKTE